VQIGIERRTAPRTVEGKETFMSELLKSVKMPKTNRYLKESDGIVRAPYKQIDEGRRNLRMM
jgi:hypothetical protein